MNDPGQREHRPTATGLIEPRRTSGPLPLSFAQERLWFLAQLEPESIAYHVPMVSELTGDLDVAALEWSLGRIVLRHEALRTVFEETPDGPRQLVRPWTGFDLPVEDLRHAEDQEQELARAQAEHARTPFDLAAGPLLRGRLLRLGERRHQLLLCVHHIVFDAWSHGVLNRELSALYTARVRGTEPDLPEPPVQYGDFALWQAAGQPGEETAALLDYWKVQLAGVSPVLQLPTDRPRPALQSYHGDLYEFDLPQELVDRLRALSRTHRVTMFMTVLAAFQLVLSRHTGRRDFLLGAPSANRGQPELDQLIGFFVNTLVLRADLRDDPTFAELLERVSETCLGAFEHQGTPFEQLVEELAPARDLSYNPLVQVLFAFQGDDGEQLSLPGVDLRTVRRQDASAKFDLTLRVKIGSDRSRAAIAFNADLFDRGTVARLAHHLRTALSAAAAAPDTRISEIEILDEDERHRTLVEWNSYGGELESATALHLLVEQQARRTPDAVAVQDGQRTLTYRALDERANRAAWLLRGAGVTTGSVVGVCAQRSVEMIVAVLGVLKAGAAYLPLDPDHPEARLRHLLEDAAVPAVLAQARFADRLAAAAGDGVPVLALTPDGDSPAEKSARSDAPGLPVHPDGLAYVIYTSGSTGRPKGVGVGHRAIVNNLLWMQRDWPLGPEDRLLHKTQFTFDVSVKELFWPLLAGARLVMADPDGHRDPAYLRELIVREQITVTHFVPSMLQAFLSEPGVEDCRSLRLVMCGAETLTVRQRDEFFRLLSAELLHLYGPTEAAIAVTAWTCERDPGTVRIPLGRPMPGCRIYVLDERMQPAPVGVPGELHIAGTPLALGYLGQATRTAESFVPDPFADVPGGRLYRTGDVARWRPDGLLEFIGRADAQVKIRGLRIEPGEVETVLRGDPAVEEAVVLVRTDGPAAVGPQLVAYVRGREPGRVTADSVRAYLRDRVPDYLVPAAVLVLADLPRLSSGKVDRNALPQPDWDRSGRDRTAPRTATERELLAIWCEVLGITEAGVHDNFFDLGGDSLLSIQVVARARRAQLSFTVRHMFRHQTIAALAATLQADTPAGGTPATAQPAAGGEVPLTPGQHRLLQLPATALTARVRALELAAEVSAGQLAEALAALTARHDALRIRVERSGTAWRQTLTEGTLPVPLRVAGPSADGPADPAASAAALRTAVDPASGQPLHAALLPRDGRPSLLLLAAHPLAVDEASWPVLLADLAGLLAAAADGRPVPPPVGGPSFAA
uniref:non-ribosomal peptide synthetase n=1 Tax=Kitasatospora sp. MBT63 TaxID=1444768 RepID=UPI0011EA6801